MKKKLTTVLSYFFYAKFAAFPLLIIFTFYFNDDIWSEFKETYTIYQIYTFIAIFLSVILPLFIIEKLPLPEKLWLLILLVFASPVSIFTDYLSGQPVVFAEIIMFDFVLQLSAILLADITLAVFNFKLYKKTNAVESKLLLDIFCLVLILSFYGYYSLSWLAEANLKTQLVYTFNLVITSYGFYKIFSTKYESYSNAEKVMGKIAIFTILAAWAILLIFIFGLMFYPS